MNETNETVGRRALVVGLGVGAAAMGAGAARAAQAGAPTEPWRAAREAQDDWMELPGRHRMVFDATSAAAAGDAIDFADTYFFANKLGYGLAPSDLAVVIILRHFATPFAFGDAVWSKYGAAFSAMITLNDPATAKPATRNIHLTAPAKADPEAASATLSALAARGVRFAVCGLATSKIAGHLAGGDAAKAAAIRAELTAGLIPGARLVPAGIVALNRTQERGYAIARMG